MPSTPLHEVIQVRAWLSEAFAAAGKGLPLPHQLALRGVEELLAFGMLGSLWTTACALERHGASPQVREAREAIESALWGQWPAPLAELRHQTLDTLAAGEEAWEACLRCLAQGQLFDQAQAQDWSIWPKA